MLHSVFGSNRPLVQVFLIIPTILGVTAAALLVEPVVHPLAGPPVAWLQKVLLDVPVVGFVIGGLLYLMSAYLINNIYNASGFSGRENYFPSLVYVIFSLGMPEWNYMHPVLWANFFVLLALRRLLMMYRVRSALAMLFDSSVFLGLAVLCFPPALIVVPLIWLALGRFRTFDLRESLVPLSGLAFVGIYAFAIYFWSGTYPDLSRFVDFGGSGLNELATRGGVFYWPYLILLSLTTLGGLVIFVLRMRTSTLHLKNTKTLFLLATLLMATCFVYTAMLEMNASGSVLLLSIPVSVFIGVFFARKRMQRWRLLLFYLWFAAAVGFIITAYG